MNYYHSRILKGRDFSAVRSEVEAALKEEGFGILTEIDFKATMKKKLGKDYLPHVILGACNPSYADKVVSIEPHISTMLPCNVTIREMENGEIEVAAMDPAAVMKVVENDKIIQHAVEVNELLKNVLKAL
ncbi:hypothetical protein MATR_35890 [Marivirga tractuosa]|uniref:DUF302 domain-containing protein n=1 Tax=Marivirga tractuosa (strain ATCC 23168 / DSM 4126 / NBRC 15989 / NCIMB 1408 / VKM B-1430 / H-43) TaxID=643867 RepID=E4TPK1_MARTH|nr:DUF302 domain-containing protein [Marivirga tractuosa]ADR22565.1 protein of unknown function DUF302 [Marivirga tractuosa DSM 4126]BDD16764.1 hypothetical protein MATR_35890 [Marivirga tractuosa]